MSLKKINEETLKYANTLSGYCQRIQCDLYSNTLASVQTAAGVKKVKSLATGMWLKVN